MEADLSQRDGNSPVHKKARKQKSSYMYFLKIIKKEETLWFFQLSQQKFPI